MSRKSLFLAPLTAIAALGVTSPSLAAGVNIGVVDYDFQPATQQIAVGDTVTWNFTEGSHTATSKPGQPDRWDSGTKGEGDTFQKTFTKPGRYQYVCIPHESFPMKGTLVVGEDSVKKTVGAVAAKVNGKKITLSFKLNEGATATLKLKGAAKRTVKSKRLAAGKRTLTVKKLKAGSYKGTLTLSDDFDNKSTVKKSFKVL